VVVTDERRSRAARDVIAMDSSDTAVTDDPGKAPLKKR